MSASPPRAAAAALAIAVLIAGCTGSGAAPSEDPEGVFRDFTAALNGGDAEAAAALVAEDAEFYGDRVADTGIDALLASLICTAEVTSAEIDGDTADLELEFTGQAPLAVPGSDCVEGTSETARVTVRDGKIIRVTEVN